MSVFGFPGTTILPRWRGLALARDNQSGQNEYVTAMDSHPDCRATVHEVAAAGS